MSNSLPARPLKYTSDLEATEAAPSTTDVSSYIADMIKGLRELTRKPDGREMAFLDYLLAMAEDEACKLGSNVYH